MKSPTTLTQRESEIVNELNQGSLPEAVAVTLGVSKRTVDFHLQNIYRKLHVSNRVSMLNVVREMGLLEGK